ILRSEATRHMEATHIAINESLTPSANPPRYSPPNERIPNASHPAGVFASATPMYLEHYGLKEAPFSITPDPRFVFLSERHRDALAHLLYGIGQGGGGGFVQLTGE